MKMEQDQGEWASNIMIIVGSTVLVIFAIVFSIVRRLVVDELPWQETIACLGASVLPMTLAVVWFRKHRREMRNS